MLKEEAQRPSDVVVMLGNSANGRTMCYTTTTTTISTQQQPATSTVVTNTNHATSNNNHTLNNNELSVDGRLAPVPCNNFITHKNETCI